MRVLFAILSILTLSQQCYSARILAVFTVPSKSHSILAYELFKELANSGHEVSSIKSELVNNLIPIY